LMGRHPCILYGNPITSRQSIFSFDWLPVHVPHTLTRFLSSTLCRNLAHSSVVLVFRLVFGLLIGLFSYLHTVIEDFAHFLWFEPTAAFCGMPFMAAYRVAFTVQNEICFCPKDLLHTDT
jgi:hypothetical protein